MIEGRRQRYLVAIIILALLLFNTPVLRVVDSLGDGGTLPVYVFGAWAAVIVLTAAVLHWRAKH